MDGWTAARVLDLAPDPSGRKAGRSLGRAGVWLSLGRDGALVWGEIKGSGAAPYRAALGLDGPASRCTCPSRKFPCKHGLGLFLVLVGAEAAVAPAPVPDWVAEWAAKRGAGSKPTPGAGATAGTEAPAAKPVDAKAQDKRRRQREAKVAAGVEELDLWLRDLVRRGLVGARGEPYAFWDRMGARLVDARAPGLARRVRALPGLLASAAVGHGGAGGADRPRSPAPAEPARRGAVPRPERQHGGVGGVQQICGAVLASLPAVRTRLVVFDTGGVAEGLLARAHRLVSSGVQFIALLALSDEGAPSYDRQLAGQLAALSVPSFACTPDLFPDLMAAAIRKEDVGRWASGVGIARAV